MEKKTNIAELLKDCPKGMKLDCAMYECVEFDCVDNDKTYPIKITIKDDVAGDVTISLTKEGYYNARHNPKCVIFPKGKTTWEGFQRPFKDGEAVYYCDTISIFKGWGDETLFRTHAVIYLYSEILDINTPIFGKGVRRELRLATEEEKEKLFAAIKAKGYKWNAVTKTLEKLPKFKAGDRVRSVNNNCQYDVKALTGTHYTLVEIVDKFQYTSPIIEDENWELVLDKFDITTLKPFESKVLVRDADNEWEGALFGRYNGDSFFTIGGLNWGQCIPYEGNEHLLGKTDDCDEFYKTWK